MDMLQVFYMNKGEGDSSYAKNSTVQSNILSITKPFVEAAMGKFLDNNDHPETLAIADFGCSSGPTALKAVSEIVNVVKSTCSEGWSPKLMVFLNDLPGNDFNRVFASLSNFYNKLKEEKGDDFGPCFIAGLPGTFHGRLLPDNTLHFAHSSSSLHWLSQVPPGLEDNDNPKMVNKGNIYLSVTSPSEVINAYKLQFQRDFSSFLKCRSHEVISGGRMVLTLMGRRLSDPAACGQGCYPWDFISYSLMSMVSEGLIEEEMVDKFNVPYYAPCLEELEQLIEEESSFIVDRLEAIEVDWDGGNRKHNQYDYCIHDNFSLSCNCRPTRGDRIAKMHRAVIESMLAHQFNFEGEILDELFYRHARILDQQLISNPNSKLLNLVVSVVRK